MILYLYLERIQCSTFQHTNKLEHETITMYMLSQKPHKINYTSDLILNIMSHLPTRDVLKNKLLMTGICHFNYQRKSACIWIGKGLLKWVKKWATFHTVPHTPPLLDNLHIKNDKVCIKYTLNWNNWIQDIT